MSRKHLRNIIQVLGARLYILIAGAALMVFLARKLSPADFGKYQLAISIATLFPIVLDWGLSHSLPRFLAQYKTTHPGQVRHILAVGLRLKLLALCVGTLVFLAAWGPLSRWLQLESLNPVFPWVIGVLVALSLHEFLIKVVEGTQRFSLMPVISFTKNSTDLIVSITLILAGLGLTGALVGKMAATLLAVALVGVFFVRGMRNIPVDAVREPGLPGKIMRYGSWMILIDVAGRLFIHADRFLINRFFDEATLGLYSVPIRLVLLSQLLGLSVASVLGPAASKSRETASQSLKASARLLFPIYTVAALGMSFLAPWLIPAVFGTEYQGSVVTTQWMALVLPFSGLSPVVSLTLNYRGEAKTRALILGSMALLSVTLLFYTIPTWGIRGAAGTIILTHILYLAAQLTYASRKLDMSVFFFTGILWRALVVGGGTWSLLLLAAPWTGDSWIRLPVFLVAAAGCLWMFHVLGVLRRSDWGHLRLGSGS